MTNLAAVHAPAFLKGVTPGQIALAIGSLAIAVVILRLTLTLGRVAALLAKMASAPATAPAKSSSGSGIRRLAILGILGLGGLLAWNTARHGGAGVAAGRPAAPSPAPTPQPSVTRTVAPHATPHFVPHFAFLDHLTGTDWVLIVLIGAVLTVTLVAPLLRRGDGS
jgi:hypothetical protein